MFKLYLKLGKKSIGLGFVALIFGLIFASEVFAKTPNDPKFPLQFGFYDQIGAPEAWEYATGTSSVIVAVIDVGVDITHEDLKNNIWKNSKEVPGNGIDDDNNGYVDDIHGWNFVENNNDISLSVIKEVDDSGAVNHGTVLAGLIGAQGNNEILGAGVNWDVTIMPVRAIDNAGGGVLANVAKAVDYAVDNGASIISISFVGFTTYPGLTDALYRAYQKGVLPVVAAGNSRNDSSGNENLTTVKQYPVCLDSDSSENWILGVASVDLQDRLSDFADYGSCIDISAPGEKIFSTQKYAPQYGYTKDFDGGWYGTSFSAPLVAGAAALVKSVRPDWKAKELMAVLLRSADDIDGLNPGFAGQMGYGRLHVGKAVALAVESKNIPPITFETKLINQKKSYAMRISANGKVLQNFPLSGYSSKFSKWMLKDDLFVYARFSNNKIIVDVWDLSGNKKLSNFVLPGMTGFSGIEVDTVWGDSPNAILFAKKGKVNQKIIIDIPSKSWKVE